MDTGMLGINILRSTSRKLGTASRKSHCVGMRQVVNPFLVVMTAEWRLPYAKGGFTNSSAPRCCCFECMLLLFFFGGDMRCETWEVICRSEFFIYASEKKWTPVGFIVHVVQAGLHCGEEVFSPSSRTCRRSKTRGHLPAFCTHPVYLVWTRSKSKS